MTFNGLKLKAEVKTFNDPFEVILLDGGSFLGETRAKMLRAPEPIDPKVRKVSTPFDLPRNEWQCCHVDTMIVGGIDLFSERIEYRRCRTNVSKGQGNGFLCMFHQDQL